MSIVNVNWPTRLIDLDELAEWRTNVGGTLVAVNGCFDLLHDGHRQFLRTAKTYGDILIVGLNSDYSVRMLKGPSRPIQDEHLRASALLETPWVDFVCIFRTLRADVFLALSKPHCWCKSEEYRDCIDLDELLVAKESSIVFVPRVAGLSTTNLCGQPEQTSKPQ